MNRRSHSHTLGLDMDKSMRHYSIRCERPSTLQCMPPSTLQFMSPAHSSACAHLRSSSYAPARSSACAEAGTTAVCLPAHGSLPAPAERQDCRSSGSVYLCGGQCIVASVEAHPIERLKHADKRCVQAASELETVMPAGWHLLFKIR